jgi:ketosteroid isomerase-like protein
MKCFAKYALSMVIALSGAAIATALSQLAVAAAEDPAALQEDREFVRAAAKGDKEAVGKLLDADFTWTDAQGKTYTKSETLTEIAQLKVSDASDAKEERRSYGQVVAVMAGQGKAYALRVWVKRPAGWRALVYHEVTLREQPAAPSGSGVKECENPCKSLPYKPKNEAEKAIVASWQALETGVTTHDSAAWAPHIADEFAMLGSSNDHPLSKADRMATLDLQKQTGVASAPAPLVSAEMFDFGDAVVMKCLHQPYSGKPIRVTRVWIKRDGKWVMSISYQTTIQAAAAKG